MLMQPVVVLRLLYVIIILLLLLQLPLLLSVLWLPAFSHPVARFLRRLGLALLCVALGFAWAAWRAEGRLAERLPSHWQGVDIELIGVIADLPHANMRGERFLLDVEQVLTRRNFKHADVMLVAVDATRVDRIQTLAVCIDFDMR